MHASATTIPMTVSEPPSAANVSGRQVFRVSVYNAVVRALSNESLRHERYEPDWADIQKRDVVADDMDAARRKVQAILPPEEGFVVTGIVVLD